MKELLVSMNNPPATVPCNCSKGNSTPPVDEESSPPRRRKQQDTTLNSTSLTADNPNWQSAVSVVGSFLSGSQNQPSSSSSSSGKSDKGNDSLASQQTIQALELEIQRLKKYNFEIQKAEIKKLKLQNEELEKALEVANQATTEAEQWADNEFHLLENKINETIKEKNEVYEKLELNKIEMERLQKQISRLTMKSTTYEEKLAALHHRIDVLEKELKETKANAINPEEFINLQNRVQELMGKKEF